MAGTPNRYGEHSCDIVSKYFFQISQRKPDLIIEPHGGASQKSYGTIVRPHQYCTSANYPSG